MLSFSRSFVHSFIGDAENFRQKKTNDTINKYCSYRCECKIVTKRSTDTIYLLLVICSPTIDEIRNAFSYQQLNFISLNSSIKYYQSSNSCCLLDILSFLFEGLIQMT